MRLAGAFIASGEHTFEYRGSTPRVCPDSPIECAFSSRIGIPYLSQGWVFETRCEFPSIRLEGRARLERAFEYCANEHAKAGTVSPLG
jgi:hypothetical protein